MRPQIWNLELFGTITLRHLYFGGAYCAGLITFMRNLKDIFYGEKRIRRFFGWQSCFQLGLIRTRHPLQIRV